jgi:hypothetical protein
MAARKKQIDPDEVRKLAMIGATIKEIAKYVGCGHATFERRFMEEVEAGRAEGGIAAKGRIYKEGVIKGPPRRERGFLGFWSNGPLRSGSRVTWHHGAKKHTTSCGPATYRLRTIYRRLLRLRNPP